MLEPCLLQPCFHDPEDGGLAALPLPRMSDGTRRGTNGFSTDGFKANFMLFDGKTFRVLLLTYFIFPKVPGRTFFPDLSKSVAFAPLALTPFVRGRGTPDRASSKER